MDPAVTADLPKEEIRAAKVDDAAAEEVDDDDDDAAMMTDEARMSRRALLEPPPRNRPPLPPLPPAPPARNTGRQAGMGGEQKSGTKTKSRQTGGLIED